jgi:threonine dehydratase
MHDVTLRDVYKAGTTIAPFTRRTPLMRCAPLSDLAGVSVFLKLENLQETGSFKIRGASNRMARMSEEQRARGVITISTGNHGRAVSHVAGQMGIRSVVCMSERVPQSKVEAIRRLGADVVVAGKSYDEAEQHSFRLEREQGLTRIEPFDDPYVIAGQGTIALELLEDLPDIDTAIVPLSGGGLMAGIALALKTADSRIRVVGVSMDRAPVMYHSLHAGRPIEMEELDTIADALAGGIGLNNRYTFRMVQRYVDETLLVSEEEIADAMAFALKQHRLVVEGGGAVCIAALLQGRVGGLSGNVVAVVSGANVSIPLLSRIAGGGWPGQAGPV